MAVEISAKILEDPGDTVPERNERIGVSMERKSTMLFVVGILLIIFGGLSLIGTLALIAGGSILGAAFGSAALTGILLVASLIAGAAGILDLYAGIKGVTNSNKPENAQSCITIAYVLIGFQAVSIIINFFAGSLSFSSFLGLVLPILYLIGANQLKKMD